MVGDVLAVISVITQLLALPLRVDMGDGVNKICFIIPTHYSLIRAFLEHFTSPDSRDEYHQGKHQTQNLSYVPHRECAIRTTTLYRMHCLLKDTKISFEHTCMNSVHLHCSINFETKSETYMRTCT